MINRGRNELSFGQAHRLGLRRGLLFMILLAIPVVIGAGTHNAVRHVFDGGIAPWVAR